MRVAPDLFSEVICYAAKGDVYIVTDVKPAWYFVEVMEKSKQKGKKAWIWAKIVEEKNGVFTVGGKGAILRTQPKKKVSTLIGYIINGAVLKILDKKATWYKVQRSADIRTKYKELWVCASHAEVIK
jgi:hypothetical protein